MQLSQTAGVMDLKSWSSSLKSWNSLLKINRVGELQSEGGERGEGKGSSRAAYGGV